MKENNKEQERFVAYITKQQCVNEAASVTDFLRKYAFRYHNSALYHLIRFSFLIVIIGRKI